MSNIANIVSRYAAEELGIQFLVGFESEFTLVKSINPLVPVNDYQWGTTFAITTGTVEAQVLEEIADAIQNDGIELQAYHAEAAPGQVRSLLHSHDYTRAVFPPVRSCHWASVSA